MHEHDFLPPLLEMISLMLDRDEDGIDPDLHKLIPPYELLLPALLRWGRSPESGSQRYHPAFEMLFGQALQGLLIDLRQDPGSAREWLDRLYHELDTAVEKNEGLIVHTLTQAMAELDFVLPEALIETLFAWQQSQFGDAGDELMGELPGEELVEQMLHETPVQSSSEFYEILRCQLHGVPLMVLEQLLPALLTSTVPIAREATLLCLLHPRKAVREAMLDALKQPAAIEGIDARGRDRLIMLRNWLPPAQREQLDPIIQRLRQREPAPAQTTAHNLKLWASAVDGAGASAVAIMTTQGRRYRVSAAILKEGVGIVDCWQTPWVRKKDVDVLVKMLRRKTPLFLPVDRSFLSLLIPHYLAANRDSGRLPEPMLLDWLELLGEGLWQPNSLNPRQWLSENANELEGLDVDAAFQRCDRWFEREQDRLDWFENPEEVFVQFEDLLVDTDLREDWANVLMEPYREKWLQRFVELSIWSRAGSSNKTPRWQDFALLAYAISTNTPVEHLPILPYVAEASFHELAALLEAEADGGPQFGLFS